MNKKILMLTGLSLICSCDLDSNYKRYSFDKNNSVCIDQNFVEMYEKSKMNQLIYNDVLIEFQLKMQGESKDSSDDGNYYVNFQSVDSVKNTNVILELKNSLNKFCSIITLTYFKFKILINL